jgi:hypothetical protein
MKPTLYLDVDGVVLPLGRGNGSCDRLRVGPFIVDVPRLIRSRLVTLLDVYDVVWATSWRDDANAEVAPTVGLPPLPVLPVDAHWRKLELVRAHAGEERAIAWIDDRLEPEAFTWAEARPGPSLLLAPDAATGMTTRHLDDLVSFAASSSGLRRTLAAIDYRSTIR